MSTPSTTPRATSPFVLHNSARRTSRRQPLSCLPCRQHKLKCDRQIPCTTCTRHDREDLCRKHPAPAKARRHHQPPTSSALDSAISAGKSPLQVPQLTNANVQATSFDAVSASDGPHDADTFHFRISSNGMGVPHQSYPKNRSGATLMSTLTTLPGIIPPFSPSIGINVAHRTCETVEDSQMAYAAHTISSGQVHPQVDQPGLNILDLNEQENLWKTFLVRLLPTRSQSDVLLSFFIEHVNWLFQTVHIPSFRKEYAAFWEAKVENANLIWLSLLFSILSIGALYIPMGAIEFLGLRDTIREKAHLWHTASLQALQAGNYESKPQLTQLQTFSITQLYWYATNNIEVLNSYVALTIQP